MDPNANLERQRSLLKRLSGALERVEDKHETAEARRQEDAEIREVSREMVEHVEALDEWMSKGGFAPKAWPTDKHLREELEKANRYREAVCEAHGATYSGTGPMDPGPDEDDFDLWAIRELRRERDLARGMVRMLTGDLEAARKAGGQWEKAAFEVARYREEDRVAADKAMAEAGIVWQAAGATIDGVAARFQAERDAERAKARLLQGGLKDAADCLMRAHGMLSAICEVDGSADRKKARDRANEGHLVARGVLIEAEKLGPAVPDQAVPGGDAAEARAPDEVKAEIERLTFALNHQDVERRDAINRAAVSLKRAELAENDTYEALSALKSLTLVVRQGLANLPDRLHGQDAELIMETLERAEKVGAPAAPAAERAVDSSRPKNPNLRYPSLGVGGASQLEGEGSIVFIESVADAAVYQEKRKVGPGTFVVPVGPRLDGDRLSGIKEDLAGLALECKALPETSFRIRTAFGATQEGREMSEVIDSIAPKGVLVLRDAPPRLGKTWSKADDERSLGPKR